MDPDPDPDPTPDPDPDPTPDPTPVFSDFIFKDGPKFFLFIYLFFTYNLPTSTLSLVLKYKKFCKNVV